jgi:hypothetical protein
MSDWQGGSQPCSEPKGYAWVFVHVACMEDQLPAHRDFDTDSTVLNFVDHVAVAPRSRPSSCVEYEPAKPHMNGLLACCRA